MPTQNRGPMRVLMIDAQSADESQSQPVNVLGLQEVAVYVQGNGTTSSGSITIETASYDLKNEQAYGGTWSSVTTVNASDVTGDKQKHVPLTDSTYEWVRARIDTAVGGGGTVTVVLVAS